MNMPSRETFQIETNSLDQLRAIFLRVYLVIMGVAAVIQGTILWLNGGLPPVLTYAIAIVAFALFGLVQQGRFIAFIANVVFVLPVVGVMFAVSPFFSVLMAIIAGFTLPLFTHVSVYIVSSIVLIVSAIRFDLLANQQTLTTYIGLILLMSTMLYAFSSQLKNIVSEARRTADLLSASAAVGQVMAQYLDLKPLLDRTVDVIRDRLAYYHVQIFLTNDESGYAELIASTGEAGRQLLARGHKLAINSNSVIGRVVQATEPIISREANRDEGHAFNEFLPNTRSELALPLVDGERVIGALDIQSLRADAFSRVDIQALQIIANQLATAIRNARLFEAQGQSLNENKRLFVEAESSLREIQRLNRQLTRQVWQNYTARTVAASGVTLDKTRFRPGGEWSQSMIQASLRRRPISQQEGERQLVAVPIELRGEVIGAIEIETEIDKLPTYDVVDMLQAVSNRLAISIDNARLFEETQEATAQEQRISEIVSGYQSAQSVEELLEITLQGLAEAIGAEEGSIRLGTVREEEEAVRMTRTLPTIRPDTSSNGHHSAGGDDGE